MGNIGSDYLANTYSNILNPAASKASKYIKAADIGKTEELTEEEKLEAFKKEIWKEIDMMPWKKSISNSIQITDGAFKRMMEEPEFKEKMLAGLREEATVQRYPIACSMTKIDENGYSGMTFHVGYGEDVFNEHSKEGFYVSKKKRNMIIQNYGRRNV